MTRSVSVRVGVALAVVLSVLAASAPPVGAMHAQSQAAGLVVGSQHTDFGTGDESSPQTLENLTVDGSGDAAAVTLGEPTGFVIEDFEDGQQALDDWSGATGGYDVTEAAARDGTYGLEHNTSSGDQGGLTKTFSSGAHDSLSVDLYSPDVSSDARPFTRWESGSTEAIRLLIDDGSVVGDAGSVIYNDGSWRDTGINIQENTWYTLEVQPDYGANTYDVVVTDDAGNAETYSDASMLNGVSEMDTVGIQADGGSEYHWDTIEAGQVGVVSSATYVSATHDVSNAEEAAINITQASNVSVDLSVEAHLSDGSWFTTDQTTVSSTGNYTVDATTLNDVQDEYRIRAEVDATGENPQFELADESILFTPHAPQASNASPADNETLSSQETTLSVDVTDDDFQTVQGDTVDVTFVVDGDEVGQSTLSSNGTASTTVTTLGETSWYAILEDEYGQEVQTETRTFNTPNTLRVLDELDPQELVDDNVSVTIRAYAGDTAITRNVTDGTANLTGFPMDQPVVITTSAEGWVDRRIIIEDLTEQQRIYLLNESAATVPITFQLSDKTGRYPPESSRLQIQKALNVTGTETLQWQTITGDYFAADLKFPTTLAADQRYRIVIQNEQGDQRVLGSYIPYEPTTTTLSIGEIVWDIPESEGVYSTSRIDDEGRLEVLYNDTAGATTRLNITAWNRSTGEEIYSTIESDVQQSVTRVPVDSENIIVSVQAEREDAPDYESSGQVGRPDVEQGVGFEKWLRLGTQVLLLGMAGLVVGQMPKKGGLIIVPLAFGVTWLGFWTIHPASLGIAGVLAIVSATNRGGY